MLCACVRQAGGSATTIYSSGGMPVQSAVFNSGTIAAIENADLNSGTIPLLRGAFVPRDFGAAIEGAAIGDHRLYLILGYYSL